MEAQKLSVTASAKAGGILWASALLGVGLINLYHPSYGKPFLEAMGSVYLWHPEVPTLGSVWILAGISLLDGAIAGALFALIYNFCLKGCCKHKA